MQSQLLWGGSLALLMTSTAQAQVAFSVRAGGPSTPGVSAADLLIPGGGNTGNPATWVPAVGSGSCPPLLLAGTYIPGYPATEMDALSTGVDELVPITDTGTGHFWYSVDAGALGLSNALLVPSTFSEAASGEAESDLFMHTNSITYGQSLFTNAQPIGVMDGDGVPLFGAQGFAGCGLIETAFGADDDLDAVDLQPSLGFTAGVYFSIDRASAASIGPGVRGGDVLVSIGGAQPAVYASASQLGLDLGLTFNVDDIDALILRENGVGGFQPSTVPFDWDPSGTGKKMREGQFVTDQLLFSVTADSAIIQNPTMDSLLGLIIEPGDVLGPPIGGGGAPAIYVTAEQLGLRTTRIGAPVPDNLNALDFTQQALVDCDGNLVDDSLDIATGAALDDDMDGELNLCDTQVFCEGKLNSQGCVPTMGYCGTPSISSPGGFSLYGTGFINNKPGLLFLGTNGSANFAFQGGQLCITPPLYRLAFVYTAGNPPPEDCSGVLTESLPNILARLNSHPIAPPVVPGLVVHAQWWVRDPAVNDGFNSSLSNGLTFTLVP